MKVCQAEPNREAVSGEILDGRLHQGYGLKAEPGRRRGPREVHRGVVV